MGTRNAARFLQGLRPRCNTDTGCIGLCSLHDPIPVVALPAHRRGPNELAGLGISPGTLQRAVQVTATCLEAPVTAIRRALVAAPVAHADETGRCVNGNLYWLHVLSTDRLTAYFPHPKRGAEALDASDLLTLFAGVLAHDHWSACQRSSCWYAFCNAHHLRELTAIAEKSPS